MTPSVEGSYLLIPPPREQTHTSPCRPIYTQLTSLLPRLADLEGSCRYHISVACPRFHRATPCSRVPNQRLPEKSSAIEAMLSPESTTRCVEVSWSRSIVSVARLHRFRASPSVP